MILKSLIETLFKQQISGSYQQQDPLNHEQLVALRISRLVAHFRRKTASERPCWSAVSVRWRALHVACVARDANPWDPRILSWHDAPATDVMQNHRLRDSDHRLTMPHRLDKPERLQKSGHNAVSTKTRQNFMKGYAQLRLWCQHVQPARAPAASTPCDLVSNRRDMCTLVVGRTLQLRHHKTSL